MATTLVPTEPTSKLRGSLTPIQKAYVPAQNATWRRGDFLKNLTTGTVTGKTPAPTGSMAALPGPAPAVGQGVFTIPNASASITSGNLTIGGASTSGAPAAAYFIACSYTATSNESLLGPEFIVVCPAGITPTVQVNSAAAPSAATNFAAYEGVVPQALLLQQATKTTTALDAAFTTPNPLTNNVGAAACAAGDSTGIIGMAANDYDQTYFGGVAGQIGNRNLFGATRSLPPLVPLPEILSAYVVKLNTIDVILNLVQTWLPSLQGASVGLNIDTNLSSANGTLWFMADTSQTACATIQGLAGGVTNGPLATGTFNQSGARVVVRFTDAALA